MESWWLKLRPLLRILAKHETTYMAEEVPEHIEELHPSGELQAGGKLISWMHRHQSDSCLGRL